MDIQIECEVGKDDLIALYDSVGWGAYTQSPDTLAKAIENSSIVVTARDEHGELIGLARGLADDASIFYLQDILVRPQHQRTVLDGNCWPSASSATATSARRSS